MSVFISARIDEAMNTKLAAIASQENQTRTAIIKEALNLYLKNWESKLSNQITILHSIENRDNNSIGGKYEIQ